mgnify:CR=1 FL=1
MSFVPLMESPPGPETVIDGIRYLYFGGTSYLGLAAHPGVIAAGCAAMQRYGVHTATTRARIGSPVLEELESQAAAFFGTEEAFVFGSGYLANHILVAALAPEVDVVVVDEGAHYCVLEAARGSGRPVASFRPHDAESLREAIAGRARVLVMADAVSPVTGVGAPLTDYLAVLEGCEQATLLLDDAHGFGVLGEHGRGFLEAQGQWDTANGRGEGAVSVCACGTLAKALGGFGGLIPGTRSFVARARISSHVFDGASAPASALAGASAEALRIVQGTPSLRADLQANVRRVREGLRALGLDVPEGSTAHLGISIGSAAEMQSLHEELKRRGILVPYIGAYSGLPPGGVLRVAVFATHAPQQIDHLLDELRLLL